MTTLNIASKQWATRPADQRFWDLNEMQAQTLKWQAESVVSKPIPLESLKVQAGDEQNIVIVGETGVPAKLTHFSFGQLCQKAGAPANYLRTLPTDLTVQNLNTSLSQKEFGDAHDARLLFRQNGSLTLRAITSEVYKRIWDAEVVKGAIGLQNAGWKVPPARPVGIAGERTRIATEADVLSGKGKAGLSINVGDIIAPAGLYASDRDCFIFMVEDQHVIENPLDPSTPLARGACIWNSEVGDASWGALRFLYDAVCGNHIIWGAQDIQEVRIRHVGEAREKAQRQLEVELREYANSAASDDEARISRAQKYILGESRQDSLQALFSFVSRKRIPLTQGILTEAYDLAAATPRYGNPNTAWAVAQGLTQLSQESGYQDRRTDIDRAAGKVMEIAF